MKHSFTVVEELDTIVPIAVGAYLDCEHYLHLHRSITDSLEIIKHEGRVVEVRQSWKWLGLRLGHTKRGEYIPPAEFKVTEVKPYPFWIPSIHHFVGIYTHIKYTAHPERNTTVMTFYVELDLPFWMWPLRKRMQTLIERMHERQNIEDMVCIKRRAKLFGRENYSAYLADHQFLYHKDDYVAHFGQKSAMTNERVNALT